MTEPSVIRKTSALRVFLTCARQETRDMLEKYQARAAIDACFILIESYSADADIWSNIIALLLRLQSYIDNCMCSNGAELCYGLSAIGAVQEGLVAAISSTNHQYGHNNHKILMEEHTLRAKLIVNGLIAKLGHDFELESLWLLAADRVQRRIELTYSEKTNNARDQMLQIKEYLTSAAKYVRIEANGSSQQSTLWRLASRQFRCAAACAALERKHPHLYAAETYHCAASFCDLEPPTSNYCELWQTAVVSMQQAGDMIAMQTDEESAKHDATITQTITFARQLVEDARRVPQLINEMKELKGKVQVSKEAILKCKDPSLKPVLQLLVENQQLQLIAREDYLQAVSQCQSMTEPARELQKVIRSTEQETSALNLHIEHHLKVAQSVEYFRKRASESERIAHCELRLLLHLCWTKAAEESEAVLQWHAGLFQDEKLVEMTYLSAGLRDRRVNAIKNYVNTADNVLASAVEYLNKARGAEAGVKDGKDPREAQMCLVQEAEQVLKSDGSDDNDPTLQRVSVEHLQRQQSLFALAAEYRSRSYSIMHKHATFPLPQGNAVRISALYKELAELQIVQATLPSNYPAEGLDTPLEESVLNCTFSFIESLTSTEPVSAETIRNCDRACAYGFRYLHAAYMGVDSSLLWVRAVKLYLNPSHYSQHQDTVFKQASPREAAIASVYALAAEAKEQGRAQLAAACAYGGSRLTVTHSSYYVLLTKKIIHAVDSSFPSDAPVEIPSEFLQLPNDDFDPALQSILEMHAAAYIIVSECECQLPNLISDEPARCVWTNAQIAVLKFTTQLTLYVNDLQNGTRKTSPESDGNLAYLKATAECYYAVAKLCAAGQAQQTCNSRAVDMCKLAERVIEYSPGQRGMATAAIELYVLALQSRLAGDLELSPFWSTAAYKARCYLEQCYSDKCGIAQSASKHAELAAQALAAQRIGRAKLSNHYKNASLCWQTLEKSLKDTKDMRGYVKNAGAPAVQKLRREADRLEALARAAHTAPDDALDGEGEDQLLEGKETGSTAIADAGSEQKQEIISIPATAVAATTHISAKVSTPLAKKNTASNSSKASFSTRTKTDPLVSADSSSAVKSPRVAARGGSETGSIVRKPVHKPHAPSNSVASVSMTSRIVPSAVAPGVGSRVARSITQRSLNVHPK